MLKARFSRFHFCQESSHWFIGSNSVNHIFWHARFTGFISEKIRENTIKVHDWITMICPSFFCGNKSDALRKRQVICFSTHLCPCIPLIQLWHLETLQKHRYTASTVCPGMLKMDIPPKLALIQLSIWAVSSNISNAIEYICNRILLHIYIYQAYLSIYLSMCIHVCVYTKRYNINLHSLAPQILVL